MKDYGKAQAYLAQAKQAWNYPGKVEKPARVPEAWSDNPLAWEPCMRELGFDWADEYRWCAADAPTATSFGYCAIVAMDKPGEFELHLTIDTEENEQDSPWVIPAARFSTPLEAAKAAMAIMIPLKALR